MCPRLIVPLLLVLAQATFASNVAVAQNLVDPRNREERAHQGGISLDEAVRMVESRYRARAVRADVTEQGGRRVYEIRLLNADGKVWKVRVDAETGRSY